VSSISLCMIVRNEEKMLERCLNSVKKVVDEIIIVDDGSTDSTKSIAKKFTNKIFDFKWCDNFSLARNYSFSKATCDYIMWLDADDVIPRESAKKIIKLKSFFNKDVYMLKYDIAFYNNKSTFSYYRERIVKNCSKSIWKGVIHECITPFGEIEYLDISIHHKKTESRYSDRNLKILKNIIKERKLTPREMYYYGRELFDNKKYKKSITVLKQFINTDNVWSENVIDACYLISICFERLNNEKCQMEYLLKTFYLDKPRANICCKIGDVFLKNKKYEVAIFWYKQAIQCENIAQKGGFVEEMFYNYYPLLQLCCCYYYIGNIEEAKKYNEKAGNFFESDVVKNNREFFNKI